MEWYNIIIAIVGGIGGVSGIISLYNAKSNKTTVDISNYQQLLEDIRKERDTARQENENYRKHVHDRVEEVKQEFTQLKKENEEFKKSILQAYRCPFPEKIQDCPVVQIYEAIENCKTCKEQ
jgi:peptidoglycan hydrolase CwlO-like protein